MTTMSRHLRLFQGTEQEETPATGPEPTVRVTLGDLIPILALANRRNYAWLHDFLDDEVLITDDLNEILQAFQRRPSA